jgi:hypothetical protein
MFLVYEMRAYEPRLCRMENGKAEQDVEGLFVDVGGDGACVQSDLLICDLARWHYIPTAEVDWTTATE